MCEHRRECSRFAASLVSGRSGRAWFLSGDEPLTDATRDGALFLNGETCCFGGDNDAGMRFWNTKAGTACCGDANLNVSLDSAADAEPVSRAAD